MHEQHDDNQLHLPAELVRELKARDVSQPFVPASVDEAVLARARAQFAAVAKADKGHDRGEAFGEGLPRAGAGGKPKTVFWGRTALAGVGSVAAALALAALLTTEPRSSEQGAIVAMADRDAEHLQSVQRQLTAPNEDAVAFDQSPMLRFDGGQVSTMKEQSAAPFDDALATADASDDVTMRRRATGFDMDAAGPKASAAPSTEAAATKLYGTGGRSAGPSPSAAEMKDIAKAERRASDAAVAAGQVMEQAGKLDADDLNQSGSLDILDVYLLARQREAGNKAVTQANIDALAARIVRLVRLEGGSL
jgi:hypothetical protein